MPPVPTRRRRKARGRRPFSDSFPPNGPDLGFSARSIAHRPIAAEKSEAPWIRLIRLIRLDRISLRQFRPSEPGMYHVSCIRYINGISILMFFFHFRKLFVLLSISIYIYIVYITHKYCVRQFLCPVTFGNFDSGRPQTQIYTALDVVLSFLTLGTRHLPNMAMAYILIFARPS